MLVRVGWSVLIEPGQGVIHGTIRIDQNIIAAKGTGVGKNGRQRRRSIPRPYGSIVGYVHEPAVRAGHTGARRTQSAKTDRFIQSLPIHTRKMARSKIEKPPDRTHAPCSLSQRSRRWLTAWPSG